MLKNSYVSCTTKAGGVKNPPHRGLINNRRLGTADLFLMRFLWDRDTTVTQSHSLAVWGGGESPCLHILIDLAPECGRVIDLPDDLFLS